MSNTSSFVTKVELETFEVRFDGFEDLPKRRGVDFVESPEFMVPMYLVNKSDGIVKVEADLLVKAPVGKVRPSRSLEET